MASYDDIIKQGRPASRHPSMSIPLRAKQFAPFSALKGYEEALREKERIYVPRPELSDEKKEELDRMLKVIRPGLTITAEYFVPASSKDKKNGTRQELTGTVTFISFSRKEMEIEGQLISFSSLLDLSGECFSAFYD